MPDIFDIDFSQQGPEILSPNKRDSITIELVNSLLSAAQWCRDLLFGSYKTGSVAPEWAAGFYNKNDQVIFNKAVYISLVGNNSTLPTNENTWLKIQKNFIGVDERVLFNGQSIVLEYAVNKNFNGTFRQPGSSSPSDIYFNNIAAIPAGFHCGIDEAGSSNVGQDTSSDAIGLRYPFTHYYNFQVNFLQSLYDETNEQAIRDFINLYIPISINYSIVTYS